MLGTLCNLHQRAYSEHLLLQRYPPSEDSSYALSEFLLAAQEFGFDTEFDPHPTPASLASHALPCLAFAPSAALDRHLPAARQSGTPGAASPVPFLVSHDGDGRLSVIRFGDTQSREIASTDLLALDGLALCHCRLRRAAPLHPDSAPETASRFGFSWFVPELLKHRKVWRDILRASCLLQLVGLVTPLLTQVVIDKVVVHQVPKGLQVDETVIIGAARVGAAPMQPVSEGQT